MGKLECSVLGLPTPVGQKAHVKLVLRGLYMRSALASVRNTFLVIALTVPVLSAQAQHGTVCVAPNSTQAPTRFTPGQNYNPATLSIRMDKGPLALWPHKQGMKIGDLDVSERHLVTVTSDGKRLFSFWFNFSEYSRSDLCLYFDGYEGARLEEPKPWCKCK
jgi:hypothetical protein